jgi:hypothetical protein
MPRFDALLTVD